MASSRSQRSFAVGSSGGLGSRRKRPRRSPDPPPPVQGPHYQPARASCSKVVADYLGIAPGVPTDRLLQVKVTTADKAEPKPNKWGVVVAACHAKLEANCQVKVALDADAAKCFVVCRDGNDAERLAHEKVIHVDRRFTVYFTRKHVLELYREEDDVVRSFQIERGLKGGLGTNRQLVGHKRNC